jgi:hypothetical protein
VWAGLGLPGFDRLGFGSWHSVVRRICDESGDGTGVLDGSVVAAVCDSFWLDLCVDIGLF